MVLWTVPHPDTGSVRGGTIVGARVSTVEGRDQHCEAGTGRVVSEFVPVNIHNHGGLPPVVGIVVSGVLVSGCMNVRVNHLGSRAVHSGDSLALRHDHWPDVSSGIILVDLLSNIPWIVTALEGPRLYLSRPRRGVPFSCPKGRDVRNIDDRVVFVGPEGPLADAPLEAGAHLVLGETLFGTMLMDSGEREFPDVTDLG